MKPTKYYLKRGEGRGSGNIIEEVDCSKYTVHIYEIIITKLTILLMYANKNSF
jgi:hypothetical protein